MGGGAAGLAAAIFAAESAGPGATIAVLDGAAKLGAKILVAGGGRCNVTNASVTADDFQFQGSPNVVRSILSRFDHQQAARWFASLGVELKQEPTGKLFPVTDSARTVLDALLRRCDALHVRRLTDHRVTAVESRDVPDGGFILTHTHGVMKARRVILAAGGRSLPKTGSDGGGYVIARGLGHSVTPTVPALVPLVLDAGFFHAALSGIAHEVTATVRVAGRTALQRTGAMLWTHFGVSGPVVMDVSRAWTLARHAGRPAELHIALLPGRSFEKVDGDLVAAAPQQPRRAVRAWLVHCAKSHPLPQRLADALAAYLRLPVDLALGQLTREQRRLIAHALTDLALPVVADRGWNHAEVTAGGVPLREIDPRTLASRTAPGLYLCGEILDIDGRIGGFNFQWAWATGHLAGRAAAESLAARSVDPSQ